MNSAYRAAKRAEIAARRADNASYLAQTARDEIAYGRSELAVSAFYGMQTEHTFFDAVNEPCTDGHSPCDFGQTQRLRSLRRVNDVCDRGIARYRARRHASNKRARAAEKHTATPDALKNAAVRDAIYSDGVPRDTGVRNVRNICDFAAGRVVVDGDLPLPVPTVDLSLVIRDLPDRQHAVAERLMAGDTAADIARATGRDRSTIRESIASIRVKLLDADPSLADGRVIDGRRQR